MNWQELAVALLLLLCAARIGTGIFAFFHKTGGKANPCADCPAKCGLKRQFDKKQQECAGRQTSKAKRHRDAPPSSSCCH